MCEQFPWSLFTLLAYCIGKGHLVAEETGINAETTVEDKSGATEELEGGSTNAVRVYFWGTAIARAVLGSLYFPPHYLKLSQVFKVRIHCLRLIFPTLRVFISQALLCNHPLRTSAPIFLSLRFKCN